MGVDLGRGGGSIVASSSSWAVSSLTLSNPGAAVDPEWRRRRTGLASGAIDIFAGVFNRFRRQWMKYCGRRNDTRNDKGDDGSKGKRGFQNEIQESSDVSQARIHGRIIKYCRVFPDILPQLLTVKISPGTACTCLTQVGTIPSLFLLSTVHSQVFAHAYQYTARTCDAGR
jgi:hypothetical protein